MIETAWVPGMDTVWFAFGVGIVIGIVGTILSTYFLLRRIEQKVLGNIFGW